MLTKAQIQRIAQRNGVGMQVQERDYVQHLILWLLYSRSQALVFKGGTALRLVYGGNRYSEDLDFNGPVMSVAPLTAEGPDDGRRTPRAMLQSFWREIIAGLEDFGVVAEMRNDWISDVGYSFDVSFHGPLHNGRDRSKGKIRIDINRRPEKVETRRDLVTSEYDDVRPFVVTVLTLEHLMAETIRALLVRGKPRDLYDIWLLLHRGGELNTALIERKLALYEMRWEPGALEEAMERVRPGWERDLRPLLPQFVPYEVARGGVAVLLE